MSWSYAGFLTDLPPGVSHQSVIFLIGRDAGRVDSVEGCGRWVR
jgi:hypothetical protein